MFMIQQAADSVATVIGNEVGSNVTLLVVAVLGAVNKFVTDLAKSGLSKFAVLPDSVKSILAFAFAQGVTLANAKWGFGASTDINLLATSAQGVVVWLASMGWNALSGVVFPKKAV
jgi:hypothetical protein